MKVAGILVHYHTPELLLPAIAALTADAEAGHLELEIVVVDNGSHPADQRTLRQLPVRVLSAGRNLGYAGGFNLGAAETSAPVLVLMNPDVLVLPGCLGSLAEALARGADAAGPRLFWDRERRFLLPPTEAATRRRELFGALAARGGGWAKIARRAWRRHAWRHWQAADPLPSFDLSGAIVAIDRAALTRIGPFDEAYELYFEETDWLQRLRRAGGRAELVPAAEAVHLYAQSSLGEPSSATWFASSQRRYRERWHGVWFRRLVEGLGRPGAPPVDEEAEASIEELLLDPGAAWLEISASPEGFPAGGSRLEAAPEARANLPDELSERRLPAGLTARAVSARGKELGIARVDLPEPGQGRRRRDRY